ENIVITGTEILRAAKDAPEFIEEVETLMGIPLTLLTGEGEAYYTAKGVALSPQVQEKNVFIMDMGGASTELIHFDKEKLQIIKTISLPVGAARSALWLQENIFDKKMD